MVHGYLFDDQTPFVKRQLLLAAERVTATETDLLITMNQYDYALAKHFQLGRQIAFIPGIGIDYSRLDSQRTGYPEQLRQELGIPQDAVLLLYAAEFSRRKSQNVLLRAMANLPKHIFLVLPGGTGRTQAACQRLAEKLQIKTGTLMWCVRIAVSGMSATPGGATEIMEVIGKDESLLRITRAINIIAPPR